MPVSEANRIIIYTTVDVSMVGKIDAVRPSPHPTQIFT
jgi:hypothetical protein